mgnify:CR=1 FL=1
MLPQAHRTAVFDWFRRRDLQDVPLSLGPDKQGHSSKRASEFCKGLGGRFHLPSCKPALERLLEFTLGITAWSKDRYANEDDTKYGDGLQVQCSTTPKVGL